MSGSNSYKNLSLSGSPPERYAGKHATTANVYASRCRSHHPRVAPKGSSKEKHPGIIQGKSPSITNILLLPEISSRSSKIKAPNRQQIYIGAPVLLHANAKPKLT